MPALVSRATREYPDYTALNCRLAQLYGASLSNSVQKVGEYQVLTLSAAGLSNRYAFGGEDMFAQLTELLFDVLFDPLKDSEAYFRWRASNRNSAKCWRCWTPSSTTK